MKTVAAQKTVVYTLPVAHIGELYSSQITGVKGLAFPGVTCSTPSAALPAGLSFDCGTLKFSGVPQATAPSVYATEITLTDTTGATVLLNVSLPIHSIQEVVSASSAPTQIPKGSGRQPAPVVMAGGMEPAGGASMGVPQIHVSSQVVEGATGITGQVSALPQTPAAWSLRVLRTPDKQQQTYQAALKDSNGAAATSIPVPATGTFTVTLASPLSAGETVLLEVDPPNGVDLAPVTTPFSIPNDIPAAQVTLTSEVMVGVAKITGTALPLANTTASGVVSTQLPSVQILVHDYNAPEDVWYPAPLVSTAAGGTPVLQQPVNSDGTWNVQLVTPPANGQCLRVVLVAPPGHVFSGQTGAGQTRLELPATAVLTPLPVITPVITSPLVAGGTTVSGVATASVANGTTVNVALVEDSGQGGGATEQGCQYADRLGDIAKKFVPLTSTSGTAVTFLPTGTDGTFKATLSSALLTGDAFYLVQIFPAGTQLSPKQGELYCNVRTQRVRDALEWGRVHADFTAGVLISNDSGNSVTGTATAGSGNFSQAHQFYALTVEKAWLLPGCYLLDRDVNGKLLCGQTRNGAAVYSPKRRGILASPGISTFFDARLTAIPVSTVSNNSSTAATTSVLTNAQTARVDVGAYFPLFLERWTLNERPNALFLAPLAKIGFDTATGPSTVNTVSATGQVQSQTFEQLYNFWSYGARIGHAELSHSTNRAPETYSYLDISIGPYSNLQSFECVAGAAPAMPNPASQCAAYGTDAAGKLLFPVDSRKRVYRLDIEGLLKIPRTPLYVGVNANIGQRTVGVIRLDQGYAAPDDLRFFFGTKFDIAALLSKFNLGAN